MSDISQSGAWQEVFLPAARFNYRETRRASGVPIAAVVKADAYGHGIRQMARLFYEEGASVIATANLREVLLLRDEFEDMPLWAMGAITQDLVSQAVSRGITLTVCSYEEARYVSALNTKTKVWVKVDTGFHRLGVPSGKAVGEILRIIALPNIDVIGLFSHLRLATQEDDLAQINEFDSIHKSLISQGVNLKRSLADSIALFRYPSAAYDLARVGALLYGCASRDTPFTPMRSTRLCARISAIHEIEEGEGLGYDENWKAARRTLIATLPIGYADGVPRRIHVNGEVALLGKRARYAGLPCMDQCMIDVTDVSAKIGDTVTLLGGNDGDAISYEEFASWLGTNRNECICNLGRRIPRVFL